MKIRSNVTGQSYEVKTYMNDDGSKGICHESLQDILENQLDGATYDIQTLAATPTYCAAACVITGASGRKVQGFNDVNTELLEGRDPRQEAFAKSHPLIAAIQAAVDTAVRAYLQWPRVISASASYSTSVITDEPNIPDAAMEAAQETETAADENIVAEAEETADTAAEAETNEVEETETVEAEKTEDNSDDKETEADAIETAMNPPEDAPAEEVPAEGHDEAPADAEDPARKEKEARLAELGKKMPPSTSRYSKKTYDELWVTNRSWFGYIVNNSKSQTYADAREYAKLKSELNGEPL